MNFLKRNTRRKGTKERIEIKGRKKKLGVKEVGGKSLMREKENWNKHCERGPFISRSGSRKCRRSGF